VNRQVRAVLFCRSTRGSAHGLEAQEERCRRKAVEAGATDLTAILDQDPGTADIRRPAIEELRNLLEARGVDLVVVDSADRLTRRIGALRALMQEVSMAAARLVFVAP